MKKLYGLLLIVSTQIHAQKINVKLTCTYPDKYVVHDTVIANRHWFDSTLYRYYPDIGKNGEYVEAPSYKTVVDTVSFSNYQIKKTSYYWYSNGEEDTVLSSTGKNMEYREYRSTRVKYDTVYCPRFLVRSKTFISYPDSKPPYEMKVDNTSLIHYKYVPKK